MRRLLPLLFRQLLVKCKAIHSQPFYNVDEVKILFEIVVAKVGNLFVFTKTRLFTSHALAYIVVDQRGRHFQKDLPFFIFG